MMMFLNENKRVLNNINSDLCNQALLHLITTSGRGISTIQNSPLRFNFSRLDISLKALTSAVAPEARMLLSGAPTQKQLSYAVV